MTAAALASAFVAVPAFGQAAPAAPATVSADAGGPSQKGRTDAVTTPDAASKRPEGWTPGIAVGGTFNLLDARNVVGQQNGTTLQLGLALDSELDFNEGMHEWRNSLRASAGTTRAPAIGEFVKTNDGLAIESIYLLHLLEWLGPYARFGFETQMFPSLDIRSAPIDYTIKNVDGTTALAHGRRLYLTDPFHPATFKESVGAFAQPVRSDTLTFEGRLGLGARETLAKDQLAIDDDSATAPVEVKQLGDVYAVGAEGVVNIWGFIDDEKRISYTFGIGVLLPFATSDLPVGDDRSLPELTTFETNLGLNVKVFDWASIGYKLNVLRDPLIVDAWQVSNNLLITIGAAFGSKAPAPPPPPPPCDCGPTSAPSAAP
jgi:hypothetical protein